MEVALDSSATGLSGAKLVPAGERLGWLLLEGNIAGDSAGVAEVEGTLAPADGTSAVAGTGELAGLPDGDDAGGDTAGAFTGDSADGEGDGTGADALDDGVGAGESGALAAGDCTGEADGLVLGEAAGDCTGEADGLVWGEAAGIVGGIFGDGEGTGDA